MRINPHTRTVQVQGTTDQILCVGRVMGQVEAWVKQWTKPRYESLVVGTIADVPRSKGELIAENALRRIVTEYVSYFNRARPHQGIKQQIPAFIDQVFMPISTGQPVLSRPVLGGLHHDYYRAT